ncbi:unnamed protein product [Leptosia nina]|uniref:Uncharacterized protein n=1 Tax=Leptosia nina TaxID=320188 RepID=A0AAV1JSL9_9NEOP
MLTIEFQVVIIYIEVIFSIYCAPKIGPILFDPLVYESKNSVKAGDNDAKDTSVDWLTRGLRSQTTEQSKPCQGYDYDVTQCKYVNDRKICGYNKNKGELKSEEYTDVGNGCRHRNGRIECGYLKAPFNKNKRRPPANDDASGEIVNSREKELRTATDKTKGLLSSEDDIEVNIQKSSNKTSSNTIQHAIALNVSDPTRRAKSLIEKSTKYCVVKNDRVLCYSVTKVV